MSYKVAGIDVHKKVVMVVVAEAGQEVGLLERKRFSTMSGDLQRLAVWLRELGVEKAVMESTAQYFVREFRCPDPNALTPRLKLCPLKSMLARSSLRQSRDQQ